MTRVKICGITNREDAQAAVAYGADALGFIFVPDTPRYVGKLRGLTQIISELPPFIFCVAVCTDAAQLNIKEIGNFDVIQHYSVPEKTMEVRNGRLIPAFRIRDESSLDAIADYILRYEPQSLLLDTYHENKLGGSGETFDWGLAIEAKRRFQLPIILAGGLTPENVADAIAQVRPYAVDVSSGVEAEPGRKDHDKLRRFLQEVRRADALLLQSEKKQV